MTSDSPSSDSATTDSPTTDSPTADFPAPDPAARAARIAALRRAIDERIVVLDGAMGTLVQTLRFTEDDFRDHPLLADHPSELQGNTDLLVLTRPDAIVDIHRSFLEAGADIVCSNTFTATTIAQADYGTGHLVSELNRQGAALARRAADEMTARTPDRPRFVAGSIGPTNRTASISPDVNDPAARGVTFAELAEAYGQAVAGLVEGGADILLIETSIDTLNAKAAIWAYLEHRTRTGTDSAAFDTAGGSSGSMPCSTRIRASSVTSDPGGPSVRSTLTVKSLRHRSG